MAARIPQMPPLDPNRPEEAFRQITAWGNDVRLALESRQAAMEGLTLNPESPLWAGRNLPGIPALPVPVPTGFQAWGVYDAIQLVWDLQPDPAIDGYELLRDSAIIDFVRANCYTDIPIGDLDAHTYELRTVRVGDGWRSAGVTATATAQTDEATIRDNHDDAFLGHQTAAMARSAATEVISVATASTFLDSGGGTTMVEVDTLTLTAPGSVPILLSAWGAGLSLENLDTVGTHRGILNLELWRDQSPPPHIRVFGVSFGGEGWDLLPGRNIIIPCAVSGIDTPPAGSQTYRLQLSGFAVDTTGTADLSDTNIRSRIASATLAAMIFKR